VTTEALFKVIAKGRTGIGPTNFKSLVEVTSSIVEDPSILQETPEADALFIKALILDKTPDTWGEMPEGIEKRQGTMAGTCLKVIEHFFGIPPIGLIDFYRTVYPDQAELISQLEELKDY